MPVTEVRSGQIKDATVGRSDVNIATPGQAIIAKIVAGTGISISSTGADTGTGDVTITATGGGAPAAHHATHEPGGSDVLANNAWTNVANTFTQNQLISLPSPAKLSLRNTSLTSGVQRFGIVADNAQSLLIQSEGDSGSQQTWLLSIYRNGDCWHAGNLTIQGTLTVNGFGTHAISASGTGGNILRVENTADGAGNYALVQLAAGATSGGIYAWPQNYSSVGANVASGLLLLSQTIGGLSIQASHASGAIRFYSGGSTERMQIDANGNVGIGTAVLSSTYRFNVRGTDSGTGMGIILHNSSVVSMFYVRNDGLGYLAGSAWVYGSDRKLKEHIEYFTDGLTTIRRLRPARFDYRAQGQKRQLGFIAQDVQPIIPDAVIVADTATGLLGLKTDFILPFVVNAVQELDTRLAALEARVKET